MGSLKLLHDLALASGLSKRNFHVLAIDCDAQANFSKASCGDDDVIGTFDIFTVKENINEAIRQLHLYDLIGTDKRLSSIDVALNKPEREFMLKKALAQLNTAYDFCIDDVQQFMNPSLIVDGILITTFNPRTKHIKEQLSRIAQVMNTNIYNTVISRCNSISVSQSDRKNIFDFPKSNAAIDYNNFIDEFLGGNIHG